MKLAIHLPSRLITFTTILSRGFKSRRGVTAEGPQMKLATAQNSYRTGCESTLNAFPFDPPKYHHRHGLPRLRMSRSVPEPLLVDNVVGRLSLLSPQQIFRSSPFSS